MQIERIEQVEQRSAALRGGLALAGIVPEARRCSDGQARAR